MVNAAASCGSYSTNIIEDKIMWLNGGRIIITFNVKWVDTSLLFTLMFLKKRFDMLSQCFVPSITEKAISYSLVLGQQPLAALQIQIFLLKYFNVS